MFGLTTTKPLCSGSSLQSTVAPRSFVDAVVGHHDGEIPLVLHGVAGADLGQRLERQRADVLAVGRAGDPHGQHAIARVGRGGAEVAHALEGRCRDREQGGGWVGHRSTIAPWTVFS